MSVTLTVNFQGVCTVVSSSTAPLLPEGVFYRVVLVNASSGLAGGMRINPHFASWRINKGDFMALDGVRMWVTPGEGPPTNQTSLNNLPNLTGLVEPIQPLGPPDAQVVLEGISQFASCHFDIFGGDLSVTAGPGASLSVSITADDSVTLHQNPFFTTVDNSMELTEDTTIDVVNFTPEELSLLDGPPITGQFTNVRHFLLQYLVASHYPPAAQLPGASPTPILLSGQLGCSNSSYP